MPSERWQHHNVNFTQILVELLVKSVLASLLHYVPMVTIQKMGKETFSSFFSKVCMPVTQEVLNIS